MSLDKYLNKPVRRRQFFKGIVAGLTVIALPSVLKNVSVHNMDEVIAINGWIIPKKALRQGNI